MKATVFRIAGILVIVGSFAFAWLLMDFDNFRDNPLHISGDGYRLLVTRGNSLKSIAATLVDDGLIEHPWYLIGLGRYLKLDNKIKAGEYDVEAGTTPDTLLTQLTNGSVVQYSLTLIEGQNFAEMLARIAEDKVLQHNLADKNAEEIMSELDARGQHPEGRFLPETYKFTRGSTDTDLLRRAYRDMESFLNEAWEQRDENLPLQTPYDALILASIIEKETGRADERKQIAGVFVRRLRKGMRLQTDPTVIYGLGDSYDGDIRYRDLRTDTPYNTYTRDGLPPTPIAMPGKDAILAALHPAEGTSLYFVARGDGSHYFSATLTEHNAAVDKYQRKR